MSARGIRIAVGVVACLLAAAREAEAGDPLSPDARRRAEDAFVEGRLEDLQSILGTGSAEEDRYPLVLMSAFWRPEGPSSAGPTVEPIPAAGASVTKRRLFWLRGSIDPATRSDEFPLPAREESDPYPRITALVLDRLRREAAGASNLPDGGPLGSVAGDAMIREFLDSAARPTFLGPQRGKWTPEELADEQREVEERQALADRNRWLGIGSVVGLVLLGWGLAALVRPGRRREDPAAERL